jgi:single-strand DNA-binding protein
MLIGNLTRDPELRYTPSGTAVCSFRVATNRSWAPSDGGERKEETEFHRIVSWNKLAELCSQLLVKGRKVYVEGRLQTRSWDTPEGEKKYMTEVVAEDMVVLDSRRPEEREEPPASEKEEPVGEPETKGSGVETKKEKEENLSKKAGKEKGKSAEETADKTKEAAESKEDVDSGEINVDDIPF